MQRPIILCFIAYYLPGYRSGGPVRSINNFVNHLGDEFDIRVVCRDRDTLDIGPYIDILVDSWSTVGKAKVFYASPKFLNLSGIARLLRETPHDILYLNSFFAFTFTGLPLVARRLGLAPKPPCVVAPRGEFSSGAIALKLLKKRMYLKTVRELGLYKGVYWQASSDFEANDIRREVGAMSQMIHVAPNLLPKLQVVDRFLNTHKARWIGSFRIIFLSRISPKKNLDFLLRSLMQVHQSVELTIYGPVEDKEYFFTCKMLIDQLPNNITATYLGEVAPDQVHDAFAASDLFVLPTRGENFGHVILESLTAGTPVLISDQTPWQSDDVGAIKTLALADPSCWTVEINRLATFDDVSMRMRRQAAQNIAKKKLKDNVVIEQNKNLFMKLFNMKI